MENLIEKIRGGDIIEYFPLGAGYQQLNHDIARIVKHQTEFKRLMHSESSFFYRHYYAARKHVLEKWFGKKQYSIDELFDMQLSAIGSLNYSLQSIIRDSRTELKQLETYFEQVNNEIMLMIERNDSAKDAAIKEKCRVYNALGRQLSSAAKGEQYFSALVSSKRIKREISEYIHQKSLVKEYIANATMEARLLDATEDLLRLSIHTCEKIALKTAVLERYLRNTRQAYDLLRMQQKAVSSLNSMVDTMSAFTLQMQAALNEGLANMEKMLNGEPFFGDALNNISGMLNYLNAANARHDRNLGAMIR